MDKSNVSNSTVPTSCPGKLQVPTDKEQEALFALKSIKERARVLKKRLAALKTSGHDENIEEMLELEKELAHLKMKWKKWEQMREKAAKERMILLGHEKD